MDTERLAYWVSCSKMTVLVETSPDGCIARTAPITRGFIGQPLANLLGWFATLGGLRYERLTDD